jgi:tetratricopeptide (TPR) repeat protein
MKKKMYANSSLFLVSVSLLVLLFSSCTLFHHPGGKSYLIKQKDTEKFFNSIRPHRKSAESHYLLGCYLQERNKHKLAVEEFMKAVKIEPTHAKAYNGMGVSHDSLGEFAKAIESYKVALELDPELDYVLNNLGYAHLLSGRWDLAIDRLQKAVALNDTEERYHNNLGLAYAMSGKYDSAFAEFKLAVGEAKAHTFLAQILYRNGSYDEAATHFAIATAMNPSDRDPYNGAEAAKSLAMILSAGPMDAEKQEESDVNTGTGNDNTGKVNAYTILSGSYKNPGYAEMRKADLIQRGYEARVQQWGTMDPLYAVNVGMFQSKQDAMAVADRIRRLEGINALIIPTRPCEPIRPEHLRDRNVEKVAPQSRRKDIHKQASSDIKIEISNGNGVNRMARAVGEYLRIKGFLPIRLTNANNFNRPKTIIYFRSGYHHQAAKLAQHLPGNHRIEMVSGLPREDTVIRVVIGKDLVPYLALFRNV